MWWMDLGVKTVIMGAKIASLWNKKIKQGLDGRRHLAESLAKDIKPSDRVVGFMLHLSENSKKDVR